MGHLFTAGGATAEGDGTRPLYVGSIAHVTSAIFPECIDYLALGHLHIPQKVSGSEVMRYCGSPLPMGFGEARQEKSLCLVEFSGRTATVELIKVPCFQQLESIRGNREDIAGRILELVVTQSQAWLEILYEGEEVITDLREHLEEATSGSGMEILRIRNNRVIDRVLNRIHDDETLDDLNEIDVFERCLDAHDVPDEQRKELMHSYQEIVMDL